MKSEMSVCEGETNIKVCNTSMTGLLDSPAEFLNCRSGDKAFKKTLVLS